jgi:acyl-CoA reductase-like NAD-dependent aldehyde dehydrogenase
MKKDLWINGEWTPAGEYRAINSPYSGKEIAKVAVASRQEVDLAIDAAEKAAPIMRAMPAWQRAAILEKVTALLTEKRQEAADILVDEAAKPLTTALMEVDRTVMTYRFAADEARHLVGEMVPMDAAPGGVGRIAFTRREPLGVIAAICPFNFPYNLVAHKVGPAIAAGNTVLLKPAGQTPLSAFFIADLFHQAGLPAGALNVIPGNGLAIGEVMMNDDRIKMITFTGSPAVGKLIRSQAGLKRVTLELGSNSALIVDRGVDIEKIIPRCIVGAFSFQGQICISLQRIFVHEDVIDSFTLQLAAAAECLRGGDPAHLDTDYSSLISASDAERVMSWISEAEAAGAKIATGGKRNGNMVTPTILTHVQPDLKVACREIFGPVVTVSPFSDLADAIDQVNRSAYGLQAGIYTPSLDHALEAAEKLEVGGVMINDIPTFRVDQMPYGGVKESGVGREGLKYAVAEMTELKLIVIHRG